MEMIWVQVDKADGTWGNISIWTMDLTGAFVLQKNFLASEVGLLSMVLTDNLCFYFSRRELWVIPIFLCIWNYFTGFATGN